MSASNYKKNLLINFNKIKKEKTKLKTKKKCINSNLIHFWTKTDKNTITDLNIKHKNIKHKPKPNTNSNLNIKTRSQTKNTITNINQLKRVIKIPK